MADLPDEANPTTGSVSYVDPEGLHKTPAFTNAVDSSSDIVGKGDVAAQTRQVVENLRAALVAGGAGPEHVVKWNLHVVEGQPLQAGFAAFQNAWPETPSPPAITMAFVAGLANPDFLVEMDAVAVVPL